MLTTHTVIPHNLSPVLGATNPLDQATELFDLWGLWGLIQATFQAQRQMLCPPTCSRYENAV